MSNELEIRKACKSFFEEEYNVELQDEFGQQVIPVRPDLFGAYKKTLFAIEIKSDKDSFARIERQLLGYQHFSNSIWIALDDSHVDRFIKKYGDNSRFGSVGILSFKKNKIKVVREAYVFRLPLLYPYLWNEELVKFFSVFKGRSKIEKNFDFMRDLIEQIFTYREIETLSRKIFLSRIKGKEIKDLFKDINIEEKQILFSKMIET